jgi:hypothetical protein
MRNQPVRPTARRRVKRRAIAKLNGEREVAIRNARRFHAECTIDGLPRLLKAAVFDLFNSH